MEITNKLNDIKLNYIQTLTSQLNDIITKRVIGDNLVNLIKVFNTNFNKSLEHFNKVSKNVNLENIKLILKGGNLYRIIALFYKFPLDVLDFFSKGDIDFQIKINELDINEYNKTKELLHSVVEYALILTYDYIKTFIPKEKKILYDLEKVLNSLEFEEYSKNKNINKDDYDTIIFNDKIFYSKNKKFKINDKINELLEIKYIHFYKKNNNKEIDIFKKINNINTKNIVLTNTDSVEFKKNIDTYSSHFTLYRLKHFFYIISSKNPDLPILYGDGEYIDVSILFNDDISYKLTENEVVKYYFNNNEYLYGYTIKELISDLERMLFYNNFYWNIRKYEKRLNRYIILLQFLMSDSIYYTLYTNIIKLMELISELTKVPFIKLTDKEIKDNINKIFIEFNKLLEYTNKIKMPLILSGLFTYFYIYLYSMDLITSANIKKYFTPELITILNRYKNKSNQDYFKLHTNILIVNDKKKYTNEQFYTINKSTFPLIFNEKITELIKLLISGIKKKTDINKKININLKSGLTLSTIID